MQVEQYVTLIAFAMIGAGLKYIDEAYDSGIFSKKIAMVVAPLLVGIWAGISATDPISAVILFSVLFAVLLTGKIDNLVFKTSAIALILFFLFTGKLGSLWAPFLVLVAMGLLDEKGNDYVDAHSAHRAFEFFFLHRFSMKLGILALCAASALPWLYLFAFLAFDIAYDFVGLVSQISAPVYVQDQQVSGSGILLRLLWIFHKF